MNKRLIARIVVLVSAMSFAMCPLAFAQEYDHEIKVKKMVFAWKVDGANLLFKLSAPTKGWVGIGFNPSKRMKDANYVLGLVKDGKGEILDEFGHKATGHKADTKLGGTDDAVLVSGVEEGKTTTMEFSMPLDSGDANDGKITVDGETVVLLGYGPDKDKFSSKHKFRKTISVNLATGEMVE